ncbi:MAG: LPS export ABC transporter permease LptG [Pseudomonadota bacterium]
MMGIASRYIMRYVIGATLVIFFVVLGIYLFISLIEQINEVGQGQYGIVDMIKFVLLTAPVRVYELFPMIGLLGSLVGLGLLASHNELTVMRTAGMSVVKIAGAVLCAAILMMIVATGIGEGLGPKLAATAQIDKVVAETGGQALQTKQGLWLRDNDNFIHIDTVLPDTSMRGITVYHFNGNQKLKKISVASDAREIDKKWYLQNVVETNFFTRKVTNTHIGKIPWQIKFNPELFKSFSLDPRQMSLYALYVYIHYQKKNQLNAVEYGYAFWQRILQPFSILIMIFLGIPFVFGSLRSVPIGLRIVVGTLIGFAFFFLNQFLGYFSLVLQIPPILAAATPLIVFALLAAWLIRRAR